MGRKWISGVRPIATRIRSSKRISSWYLNHKRRINSLIGNQDISVSSVSVAADGVTWTIVFNQSANEGAAWDVGDFSATGSTAGAIAFSGDTGDGTNTWTLTGDTALVYGETATLDWAGTADGIEDSEGEDLAAFSGRSATNNVPSTDTDNLLLETGDNLLLESGDLLLLETA